jgi:hypothetical protein
MQRFIYSELVVVIAMLAGICAAEQSQSHVEVEQINYCSVDTDFSMAKVTLKITLRNQSDDSWIVARRFGSLQQLDLRKIGSRVRYHPDVHRYGETEIRIGATPDPNLFEIAAPGSIIVREVTMSIPLGAPSSLGNGEYVLSGFVETWPLYADHATAKTAKNKWKTSGRLLFRTISIRKLPVTIAIPANISVCPHSPDKP